MSEESVKLYVYDLSRGMAKSMSMGLTGKQIDGIWHTSVVVYGQEFFYGQGISVEQPGQTIHGQPLDVIDIGTTFLPLEVFVEYIDNQRSLYTAEKYHLLDFNCNTFSNDVCQFLTGESIPNHITELPAEFMNTPLGQSLMPMIEGMFGQSRLNNGQSSSASAANQQATSEAASILQGVASSAMSAAPASVSQQAVQTVTSLQTLDSLLNTYPAVAVFFTSATCPPCRVIKPDFERLIHEKNEGVASLRILGVIVDTSMAYDVGAKFQVRATPTFMFFHKGVKMTEFRGANFAELKSSIDLLLFTAHPPHPHRKLHLKEICKGDTNPILYKARNKADLVVDKLESYLKEDGIRLDDAQSATLAKFKEPHPENAIDSIRWQGLADVIYAKLPKDHHFPFLDLFSSFLLTEDAGTFYTANSNTLAKWLDLKQGVAKATWMMTLRLACNIFTHAVLTHSSFTSHLPSSHRPGLTQLLVNSLLAEDPKVRQAAASLAFNCSTVVLAARLKSEQDGSSAAEQGDDDWHVEMASAVVDALAKETDVHTAHRLLACLGNLVFLAPTDSTVTSLLQALDTVSLLEGKRSLWAENGAILGLSRDLIQMLEQEN
ncbi:DUF862-domain-containing protein [Hesseltinella vesiculosa]|uniref:DUF862-domain-containing protein n=1 Tax=Hesseltinella vesiculosa TaxID=101127 RepID=A0A1X2GJL5_9FUNG|nr:DUF862-domain-containing protein [Hesseltinella vesiculosa]